MLIPVNFVCQSFPVNQAFCRSVRPFCAAVAVLQNFLDQLQQHGYYTSSLYFILQPTCQQSCEQIISQPSEGKKEKKRNAINSETH
jgi:hypothetical protein